MTNKKAIEILKNYHKGYFGYKIDEVHEAHNLAIKALEERPQGEWIDHSDEGYVECPFCHEATNCDDNKEELHFCFNCGADMRGDVE